MKKSGRVGVLTIKDVAEQAGVAVSTVSRVLNGLDRVSGETRERVMTVVRRTGYQQNQLAKAMITRRTGTTRWPSGRGTRPSCTWAWLPACPR